MIVQPVFFFKETMKKSEYIERYGIEAYEEYLCKCKQYRAEHRKERAAKQKQYMKQYWAEHKEQKAAYDKQYRAEHKKEIAEYDRQRYTENREKILEQKKQYMKQYRETPIGRANCLAGGYRQMDKQKGFKNVANQVTKEWIMNNIFTSSCVYCGETDWHLLGCDRIDNDKPHTIDNIVCCCWDCNNERKKMPFDEYLAMKKKQQ